MSLIDYLSDKDNRILIENETIVDPEFKINKRFSEHSDFVKQQYETLLSVYLFALREATKNIDSVEAIIISSFLMTESDIFLSKNDNNPKAALNEMVEFFYEKLSKSKIINFDKTAILFYLLDEMINCNIFPNN